MGIGAIAAGAVIYLLLIAWVLAICHVAGRADREQRILEGRPDTELEALGGFAVAARGFEPEERAVDRAFAGLYLAQVP